MSSKIKIIVGLSKTGPVLSTATYLMLFQVLLQFYYCRIYACIEDALSHVKSRLNMRRWHSTWVQKWSGSGSVCIILKL